LNTKLEHLRSLYLQSKPTPGTPLNPEQQQLHDKLKKLDEEREELLTEQMNKLDNELAVNDRAALREFLTKQSVIRVVPVQSFQPANSITAPSNNGGGK
jgi:hypothetical protein